MNDKITPEPHAIEGVRISGQIDEVGRLFEEESSSTSLTSAQRPLQDKDNNLTTATTNTKFSIGHYYIKI